MSESDDEWGTRLEELRVNLTHIDAALANTSDMTGSEIASLIRERRITLEAIEAIPKVSGSVRDDVAAKRAQRRADAAAAHSAATA
jgi:hypothetical protein